MAVFTHLSEEQVRAHLAQYDIGGLVSFEGITDGVQNSNYKLVTAQGAFILTLFENPRLAEDLPFFTAFMKHLHDRGIPCPAIIAAGNGAETLPLAGRPALIGNFLEGHWPRQVEGAHAAAAGRTLGRMHRAGASFGMTRPNALPPVACKPRLAACAGKTDLLPFLNEEMAYVEANAPQGLPAGAVHADFFPDNTLFAGEELTGVLDFYAACTDVFAYDLMMAFNAWCFRNGAPDRQNAVLFMQAYEKERPLSAAEKDSLNFFGRAAALRIISTRLYNWLHPVAGAVVRAKDPQEFVKILKSHQRESLAA